MVEFSLGRTYVSILPFGPWGLFEFFCRLGEYEKGLRVGSGFFSFSLQHRESMNMQSLFPMFEHLQLHSARQSVSHQVRLRIDSKLVSLTHRSSYYMSSYRATSMYSVFMSLLFQWNSY